jgi:hypothetical protein
MLVDLLFLTISVGLACAIYWLWAVRLVIVRGFTTGLFAWFMSAHALLNLAVRTLAAVHQDLPSLLVAEASALVFAGTYLNMLWRYDAGSVRAGLSLALAGASTALLFMAAGLIEPNGELVAWSAAIMGLSFVVIRCDTCLKTQSGRVSR